MSRIVVSQFVTLDGVFEDPGGSEGIDRGGWAFRYERGEEGDRFKLDEVMAADGLLLGRVTYAGFAAAWPSRTDEFGFADKFNTMPKYVVSSTLSRPGVEQHAGRDARRAARSSRASCSSTAAGSSCRRCSSAASWTSCG